MKLKRDQIVIVKSGDDRGKTGKILKVFLKENKVLVEGVGSYKKHLKQQPNGKEGGVVTRYRPIHASKVAALANEAPIKAVKKTSKKSK